MKKLIVITILCIASVCMATDIIITVRIPSDKVPVFQEYFFEYLPVPMVANPEFGEDPNEPVTIPQYTEKNWIKKTLTDFLLRALRKGKDRIASRTSVVDPNTIQ